MKFHWFHLMPYPDLPEDFREKNRSVWVDVDASLYDPMVGHQAYTTTWTSWNMPTNWVLTASASMSTIRTPMG